MSAKINTDIFIERSIKIHGDKYDYSDVEYKNMKTKVRIVCESEYNIQNRYKNKIKL